MFTFVTNEPVNTRIKRKKAPGIPYNIIVHDAYSELIADKLCYRFASITAMFFLLTIVMYKG